MDATTIVFTMWIGSFCFRGQDDVRIGRAMALSQSCVGGYADIRPTFDTTCEVLEEDADHAPAGSAT